MRCWLMELGIDVLEEFCVLFGEVGHDVAADATQKVKPDASYVVCWRVVDLLRGNRIWTTKQLLDIPEHEVGFVCLLIRKHNLHMRRGK